MNLLEADNMTMSYQHKHDDLDIELYYSFIPFVVKSWFAKHPQAKSLQIYYDDIVSELYTMYKTDKTFESLDSTWIDDIGLWYIIFFYRIPRVLQTLVPDYDLLADIPHNHGIEDNNTDVLLTELLQNSISTSDKNVLATAYLYYMRSYTRKEIAKVLGVSLSTVSRWLDQANRMLKKIFKEE